MPKSTRHHNMARKAAMNAPEKKPYLITDPSHIPDLRGEFAGAKVKRNGAQQIVYLTPAQAKFYSDQGALKPLAS
jgi:hypothetical protein